MKEMKYKDYIKEQNNNNSRKWDFKLFKIICNKCGSKKVEFNSDLEVNSGYYGDYEIEGGIIVKCHNCGNAIKIGHYNVVNN